MSDVLKAIFKLFKPATQSQRIEEYLSDSISLSDLEDWCHWKTEHTRNIIKHLIK